MKKEGQEQKLTNMAEKKVMQTEAHTERGPQVTKVPGHQKTSKKYDAALLAVDAANSPKKIASVVKLLEAAHESGDSRAAYALGTWHFHGKFFKQNQKRGFLLMQQAADHFVADACFDVAVSYERGEGVRKNLKKAATYYFRAMMLGDKKAIPEVGRLFYWGMGFPKHRGIAKELLNFGSPRKDA